MEVFLLKKNKKKEKRETENKKVRGNYLIAPPNLMEC